MTTTNCTCESCNSVFVIKYEEDSVDDAQPGYCPFCGEKLFLDDEFVFVSDVDDFDEGISLKDDLSDINDDMDS